MGRESPDRRAARLKATRERMLSKFGDEIDAQEKSSAR